MFLPGRSLQENDGADWSRRIKGYKGVTRGGLTTWNTHHAKIGKPKPFISSSNLKLSYTHSDAVSRCCGDSPRVGQDTLLVQDGYMRIRAGACAPQLRSCSGTASSHRRLSKSYSYPDPAKAAVSAGHQSAGPSWRRCFLAHRFELPVQLFYIF